ncbi:MAG: hypothetical protein QGF71_07950 [Rhodospirillales bacterium]|nr:hypothetical protein [Rhodospirillales bacterium]
MIILPAQFDFNRLEITISRAPKRRKFTDLETGLLNISANAVARAERGAA